MSQIAATVPSADAGKDEMRGFSGNDTMYGGTEDDLLLAGDGVDKLHGQDGLDRLYGGLGVDELYGGNQDDKLWDIQTPGLFDCGAGNDGRSAGPPNNGVDNCEYILAAQP